MMVVVSLATWEETFSGLLGRSQVGMAGSAENLDTLSQAVAKVVAAAYEAVAHRRPSSPHMNMQHA